MYSIIDLSEIYSFDYFHMLRDLILDIPESLMKDAEYGHKMKLDNSTDISSIIPLEIRFTVAKIIKDNLNTVINLRKCYIKNGILLHNTNQSQQDYIFDSIFKGFKSPIIKLAVQEIVNGDINSEINHIDVNISYQISVMKNNSFINPHTDKKTKLASMLIYLPSIEQNGIKELGTTFWQPTRTYTDKQLVDTDKHELNRLNWLKERFTQTKTIFRSQQILVFFRTSNSWHSVDYLQEIDYGKRISININLDIDNSMENGCIN